MGHNAEDIHIFEQFSIKDKPVIRDNPLRI